MGERIEALLAAQRNLLHSVSHELRTPIARLEFALELLRSKAADPALEGRIDAMEGDLRELNALVTELLGMTKLSGQLNALQSGQAVLARAPFAIGPALQSCVAALAFEPAARQLRSHFDAELGDIDGVARLFERAVGNLLRNALKYGEQTVQLSARRVGPGLLEVVVEDDGPGIPEDERERVFEPFYRLDRSRDRASGGFGLGLSIARQAVQLHGGTLVVDGSPLGGARFVLRLPG